MSESFVILDRPIREPVINSETLSSIDISKYRYEYSLMQISKSPACAVVT